MSFKDKIRLLSRRKNDQMKKILNEDAYKKIILTVKIGYYTVLWFPVVIYALLFFNKGI